MNQILNIPEEFVMAALSNQTGRFKISLATYIRPYTVASIFTELLLQHKVEVEQGIVKVMDNSPIGVKYLDRYLEKIAAEKKRTLSEWMMEIMYWHSLTDQNVHKEVVESLVTKGILKKEEGKVLFLIPYTKFVETGSETEDTIAQKLRAHLLEAGPVDERVMALALVLDQTGLLAEYFSHHEKEQLESKMEEIKSSDKGAYYIELLKSAKQASDYASSIPV